MASLGISNRIDQIVQYSDSSKFYKVDGSFSLEDFKSKMSSIAENVDELFPAGSKVTEYHLCSLISQADTMPKDLKKLFQALDCLINLKQEFEGSERFLFYKLDGSSDDVAESIMKTTVEQINVSLTKLQDFFKTSWTNLVNAAQKFNLPTETQELLRGSKLPADPDLHPNYIGNIDEILKFIEGLPTPAEVSR